MTRACVLGNQGIIFGECNKDNRWIMSNFIHEHTTAQTALLGFEECRKEVRKLPESVFMRHAVKCFIRK